ncbi:MAG: class I SAM-dependent methyltransferase, partial [Armatimonadota bacterium]|nr:class I SAM-dependent methyltransferase [Armatimonadota bacterium]
MNNRSLLQSLPQPIRSAASMAKLTLISRRQQFREIGKSTLRHLVEAGGLQSNESVLEIGCGYGRIALPLTHYLNASGRYEGID